MKRLLHFVFTIIILGIAGYFILQYYGPQIGLDLPNLKTILNKTISNKEMTVFINKDITSDVVASIKGDSGESVTAFQKRIGNKRILEELAIQTIDNKFVQIFLDNNGLVTKAESEGITITYSNHKPNSVDAVITRPDGSSEKIEDMPISVPEFTTSAIPLAKAQTNFGLSNLQYSSKPLGTTDSGDVISTWDAINNVWTAVNFVSCGTALVSLLPTFGASASWGLLSCGSVAAKVAINYTEFPPCMTAEDKAKGNIQCLINELNEGLLKVTGPQVSGIVKDLETKDPIENVSIEILRSSGSHKLSFLSWENGKYYLGDFTETGSFTATISKNNYKTKTLTIAVTADRIKIVDESEKILLDSNYKYSGKLIEMNVNLTLERETLHPYDGRWDGNAISLQESVGDTECASATFFWNINESNITGEAIVDEDYKINLKGTVDGSGKVKAGTGLSLIEQVTFEGQIIDSAVSGQWIGSSGCSGTFSANRK